MRDGLYRVEYGAVTAGFVIRNGKLEACAPILRARLKCMSYGHPMPQWFATRAVWIGP